MAKTNEPNFIDKHIEKVVLGICALLLVVAVLSSGLSSSRTVEVGGKQYVPGEADEAILKFAKRVYEDVRKKDPPERQPNDPLDEALAWYGKNPFPPELNILADVGGITKAIEAEDIRPPVLVSLAEIESAFEFNVAPAAEAEYELPRPQENEKPADKRVARSVAILPYGQWEKLLSEKLKDTPINPSIVIYDVQWQRRTKVAEGWSDGQDITCAGESIMGDKPEVPIPASGEMDEPTELVIQEIASYQWQEEILQREYPDIYVAGWDWMGWRINLPDNPVSKAAANDPSIQLKTGRDVSRMMMPTPTKDTSTGDKRRQTDAMRKMMQFQNQGPRGPGGSGPGRYNQPKQPRRKPKRAGADKKDEPADQEKAPEEVPVPTIDSQFASGNLLAWVHDDSLQSGRQYEYRLRVKLINPLYLSHSDVKDKKVDSQARYITTSWSKWSAPVAVPHLTELFLTGAQAPQGSISGKMKVTVFTRKLGQYVKGDFMVGPGQGIGGPAKVKVKNPVDGSTMEDEVNFTTGAVTVQMDYRRKVLKGSRRLVETPAMMYLDDKGVLRTRIREFDRTSLRYKELDRLAKETKAALEGI